MYIEAYGPNKADIFVGKVVREWPSGVVTLEDERGLRYTPTKDRVIGPCEPPQWAPKQTAHNDLFGPLGNS